jgi:hypothetical protein
MDMTQVRPYTLIFLVCGLASSSFGQGGVRVTGPKVSGNTNVGGVGAVGSQLGTTLGPGAGSLNVQATVMGSFNNLSMNPAGHTRSAAAAATPQAATMRLDAGVKASPQGALTVAAPGSIQTPSQAGRVSGSGALIHPGGSGGPKIGSVDNTAKDLGAARKAEKKGQSGALTDQLNSMFEGIKVKAPGGANVPDQTAGASVEGGLGSMVESAPLDPAAYGADPTKVGLETAVTKLGQLGNSVDAAEAPLFYNVAAEMARVGGDSALQTKIVAQARKRGTYQVVSEIGHRALKAAAAGKNSDRFVRGVAAWNKVLSTPEKPFVTNYSDFRQAVARLKAGKTVAKPGSQIDVSKAVFTPQGSQLTFSWAKSDGVAEMINAVPSQLATQIEMKMIAAEAAWMPTLTLSGPAPSDNFASEAQAGLRRMLSEHGWVSGFALYLKARSMDFVRRIIAAVRAWFIDSARMSLQLGQQQMGKLRAAPALIIVGRPDSGRVSDDLGLDIQLQPALQ